jgi:DNA primase
LAFLPIEAHQAANRIRLRDFTEQQRSQFEQLISALSSLATQRTALRTRLFEFPAKLHALVRTEFEHLEIEFGQMLDAFADCFRKGDSRREFPTMRGALDGMRQRVEQIRREHILDAESLDAPTRLVEVVSRYQTIGEVLEECAGLIKSLNLHRYWGDYAL